MNTAHLDTLAHALDAAGLGSYREAHALLMALEHQAGGDADHHAAHAAMLLRLPAAAMTDLIATSSVGGQQSILARLVHSGMALEAILALLPRKERTA